MRISRLWKKVWKVTGITLGVLLILQLIATFFLGPVLANRLSEQVEEASFGVYKISNRSANLNLMNGSLVIRDLKVEVDTVRQIALQGKKSASYQLKAPKISLKGMEIYEALRSKKLRISALKIDQPEITFWEGTAAPDSIDLRTLPDLTNGRLTQVVIEQLQVKEGSFTYFSDPVKGREVFEVKDIFLLIKNFQLDSTARVFSDHSFFAEEIEVGADIRDYSFITADSLYKIKVGKIGIATHRSELLAGDISIQPFLKKIAGMNNAPKPALAAIKLPRLRLEGVDLHELYFDRKAKLKALRLIEPELTLVRSEDLQDLFESKNPLGLDVLEREIRPFLSAFEVEEIEISNARVHQKENWEDSTHAVSVQDMNISLRNFSLDSLSRRKLLRADDIVLEVERYDLELIPETYRISGKNLWLSTQSRFLLTDSLRLLPGPRAYEAARKGNAGPPDVYEISLPSLAIEGVDADQAYFDRRLDVNKIYLGGPQVRLTNYPQVERAQVSALAKSDFYDLISSQLKSLVITDLEVDEGQFFFDTNTPDDRKGFSVNDIDVQVRNFRLDSTTRKKTNLPFYADDISININVEGYSFTLPDSNHQVTIGEIGVSTKDSIIFASSIRFSPTPRAYLQPDSAKTNLYDLFVPRFELQGLNVLELYLDKALHVGGIQLQQPLLRMHAYGKEEGQDVESFDIKQAYQLIAPSLNALSIGRLSIEGGTFHHTSHKGNKLSDFSIPDVWMMLEGFSLDSTSRMGEDNFLFAEAIEARIRGFHQLLGDSVHSLSVAELGLSSSNREVYMDGIQLTPTADSSKQKNVPTLYSLFVPQLRVQGINPYQLYNDRDLYVDSILLTSPRFELANYPQVNKEKLDSLAQSDLYGLISGYLSSLEVENLQVENGSFQIKDKRISTGDDFQAQEVAIQIRKFRLDSLARSQSNNPFYAEDIAINLNIDQYKLMLPDSSYQLQAGNIGFSSGGSTIFIDSLRLIPEKVVGQAASILIPQLQLEGINLLQLYLHHELELAALRMKRPQLSLRDPLPTFHHVSKGQKMADVLNPDIYDSMEPYLSLVHIASVEIYNGWAACRMEDGTPLIIPDYYLHLEDFRLDQWAHQRLWHYLFAKEFTLQLKDFRYRINDMYDVKLEKMNLSSCEDSLSIDSLQLIPGYDRYGYGAKLNYSTDRVDMCLSRVVFKGLDIWSLLVDQKMEAREFVVRGMNFDVFRDRRYPDTVFRRKILPQEWLRKFPMYIRIDTARIERGEVTYGEHIEGADAAGFFNIQNIHAKIFPITNDSLLLKKNPITEMKSAATLMKTGQVKVNFRFNVLDTLDKYSFAGVLSPWDLKELNVITEPAAFVSIKSGYVHKLTFQVTADKYEAKGRMRCYYNDLRISVLNRKSGNLKNVQSFFANSFVVRANNPPQNNRFLRAGRIYAENDPNRSIFNYWYRSLRSGISSSISIKGERDRIKDFLRNFEID